MANFLMNAVTLEGNLVKDAEIKIFSTDTSLMKFDIAWNTSKKDKNTDEWIKSPNFMRIELWGRRASQLDGLLKKGMRVVVFGELKAELTDVNGVQIKYVSVVAEKVNMIVSEKFESKPKDMSLQARMDRYPR